MPSPVKWLSNEEYANAPQKEKAVAVADSYVGQEEVGHNAGPFVTMLLKAIGLGPGFAWCAAFISWCLIKAGFYGGPKFGRGSVKNWVDWAFKNGKLYYSGPRRGDLIATLNNDGTGHIEIVITPPDFDGTMRTIGGNTNRAREREGDAVTKGPRKFRAGMKIIRWWE